jgi:hypothetical protein
LLLSERVRIEVFIPEAPSTSYAKLLNQLRLEFSYAFGGCSVLTASGSFLSATGAVLPDTINILFTDISLSFHRDRLVIGQYTERLKTATHDALKREEAILVSVYPVYHDE